MANVKNAVIFSFLSKYSGLLIQVCGTAVLARILTPEEYGIFSIAFIFLAFANVLKDVGVTQYLIKEKELNNEKIRSAYTILIFFSALIAGLLYIFASHISLFYKEPRLELMIQLLSLNILLSPFGSIITALLSRNLEFRPTFIASIVSQLLSYGSMIYFAVHGYGEITLAVGTIISTLATIFVLQFFRPAEIPLLPGIGNIKEVFHYSKFVLGTALIGQIGHYFSQLAIGKYFNIDSVGLLNRAISSADMFNQLFSESLYKVITPYVSKINREDQQTNEIFFLLTKIQLNIALPFFSLLALFAQDILVILFGEQWIDAALFLGLICGERIIFSLTQHFKAVFMGMGHAKEVMRLALVTNVLRIVVIALTVQYGIKTMLIFLYAVPVTNVAYSLYLLSKILGISTKEYLYTCLYPICFSFLTVLPLLALQFFMKHDGLFYFVMLIACGLLSVVIWLISIWKQGLGVVIVEKLNLSFGSK